MTPTAPTHRRMPIIARVLLAPLHWLERARGRRRLALIGLYLVVLAAAGVGGWRVTRLWGLPDVGEPPGLDAIREVDVPEGRNAAVGLREAVAGLKRSRGIELRLLNGPYAAPAAGDAEGLAYLDANAAAMELWRESTERPDMMIVRPRDMTVSSSLAILNEHRHFCRLALVAAGRERVAGNVEAAWAWHRSVLRGSRLAGRNSPLIARLVGISELGMAVNPVLAWAGDPRVDAAMLRRAFDDVRALDDLGPTEFETLGIEYLSVDRSLRDVDSLLAMVSDRQDPAALVAHIPGLFRAVYWVENEPERTRRLHDLLARNWLSQAEVPPSARPATVHGGRKPGGYDAYDVPTSGISARMLVARIEGSMMASWLLSNTSSFMSALGRERGYLARLEVGLAEELHAREHGGPPGSVEALVGPYLDRLPEGYDPEAGVTNP